jgi:hypothetical protein
MEKDTIEDKLRKLLNIEEAGPKVILTAEKVEKYRSRIKFIFHLWRTSWLGRVRASDDRLVGFSIKVPSTFVLQERFEYWKRNEGSNPCLFACLETEFTRWLLPWEIVFSGKYPHVGSRDKLSAINF